MRESPGPLPTPSGVNRPMMRLENRGGRQGGRTSGHHPGPIQVVKLMTKDKSPSPSFSPHEYDFEDSLSAEN